MKLNKPFAEKALLAATIALASAGAAAGPIVTQWSYVNDATFENAVFTTGGSGTTTENQYELSWGVTGGEFENPTAGSNQNRSALTIGNGDTGELTGGGPTTGSVDTVTDGSPVPTGSEIGLGPNFTHWNNVISSAFDRVESGDVTVSLTLTPEMPDMGPAQDAPTLDFTFSFIETPNNGGPDGQCAGGTGIPCADLFGLTGFPELNQILLYDGNEYLVSLLVFDPADQSVSPIGTLLDEECSDLGLATGCLGFRTEEAQETTVQFALAISTDPVFPGPGVPAPATLALLGLGLAGIGFGRRRA